MSILLRSPYPDDFSNTQYFFHTDSEKLYQKNLRLFGNKWQWKDKPIEYKLNSDGYRMEKELTEVDTSNYYAFFGCSFSVGVGLPLNETYAYRIAKQANVDYINGAIGGGSVDFVLYNISQLFFSDFAKPKVIIINWPELTRTAYWIDNVLHHYLVNSYRMPFWEPSYKQFLLEESHINNRFAMMRKTVAALCKGYNTKLYEFTTHQADIEFYIKHPGINTARLFPEDLTQWPITDPELLGKLCARDVLDCEKENYGHPGIFFQEEVTKSFFEWLKQG